MGDIREHLQKNDTAHRAQLAREYADAERDVVRLLNILHLEMLALAADMRAVDSEAADTFVHDVAGQLLDFKSDHFGHVDMESAA